MIRPIPASLNELKADLAVETPAPIFNSEDTGHIALTNLTFGYRRRLLFQELSINFHAGTTTLINGANGSGKSTLMDLIFGFIRPQSGEISVNGIKHSQEKFKIPDISYLEQDPALFNVSIMENISLAKPGSTYEEVASAVKAAGLKEHINLLPDGLLHMVEEGGINLSGGQKRMICLARVIIKDSSIVMFDEPTEGLDENAEHNFIELVNSWHKYKTVLIITHKDLSGLIIDKSYQLTDSGLKAVQGSLIREGISCPDK
jgi:ABC-type bacteriocin/lantibiotic exporter with double-glycine peptidase domain